IASQTSTTGFDESIPLRSGGWNRFSVSDAGGKLMKSGFRGFSSSQVPLNRSLKKVYSILYIVLTSHGVGNPVLTGNGAAGAMASSRSWNGLVRPPPVSSLNTLVSRPASMEDWKASP